MSARSTLLLLLLLQAENIDAVNPEIVMAPVSRRVGLNHPQLVFPCTIRGDDLCWIVNGVRFDVTNRASFRARGITFSSSVHSGDTARGRVMVDVTPINNNTEIICEALAFGSNPVTSIPAIIFIAGVPLPPSPEFSVVDVLTVQVEWETPFTWPDFPVTNYTVAVEVSNQTSANAALETFVLGLDRLSYTLTQAASVSSCTNVTFSVFANNSVGSSVPGRTQGSFPSRPGVFLESPRSDVTFTRNNSPILDLNFTFPSVCSYQNATYHIVIEETSSGMIVHTVGPLIRHWRETNSLVTVELREGGLQPNMFYSATVNVTTLAGQEFITFTFDTSTVMQQPTNNDTLVTTVVWQPTNNDTLTTTTVAPTTKDTVKIVLTCIGTLLAVLLIAGSIAGTTLSGVYVYRRSVKRKREHTGVTEFDMGHIKPMVHNPIYEGGAIYEEIADLKNLKSLSHDKGVEEIIQPMNEGEEAYTTISAPGVACMGYPKLSNPQEDTYTMMKSVGPLPREQMLDGATATSATAAEKDTEQRYIFI